MSIDETIPEIQDLEVIELIGRGTMGAVYRGHQQLLDREVAVKFLNPDLASNPNQMMERFRREARLLASLSHGNIVSCYHAGVADEEGKIYLVMELVKGPDMAQYLVKHGAMPVRLALKTIRDLADALRYANEHRIIHRDIKPANILLQSEDQNTSSSGFPYTPKLADLGLARYQYLAEDGAAELTNMGTIMGSPVYMAPEQIEQPDGVDFRADIYGLGCVLFQALTGEKPFKGNTVTEVIHKKLSGQVPDPKPLTENLEEEVAVLVRRMMAKKREDRPQSYDEIIQAIDSLMGDSSKNVKKSWAPVYTGIILLFVLGLAGGVVYTSGKEDTVQRTKPETVNQEANEIMVAIEEPEPQEAEAFIPQEELALPPTSVPEPDPIPGTITDVLWDEDGTALLNLDYLNRLALWDVDGSWGAQEDEGGTGIVGVGTGSISYAPESTPWMVIGSLEPITSTTFGVMVVTESESTYRLLMQSLGDTILLRIDKKDRNGVTTQIEGGFTMPKPEVLGFKAAALGEAIEFMVIGTDKELPVFTIDSQAVRFGLFNEKGSVHADDLSIHYPFEG